MAFTSALLITSQVINAMEKEPQQIPHIVFVEPNETIEINLAGFLPSQCFLL